MQTQNPKRQLDPYRESGEPDPINRKLLRLRKKHLPVYEKLNETEFEDWLQEELFRYQRTKESTSETIGGIVRAIRKVVYVVAKRYKQLCSFEDLLHDAAIRLLEHEAKLWNPLKGGASRYLTFKAMAYTVRQVPKYKSEHMVELDPYSLRTWDQAEEWFVEDFIDELPILQWRLDSRICNLIAIHLMAGQPRSEVIRLLRRTVFKVSKSDGQSNAEAQIHYQYVLVILRITLREKLNGLDRGSEIPLPTKPNQRISESLRGEGDEAAD